MNTQEAAALLAVAAAFDNRKPDTDAAMAWALALEGLRFIDCRDAIVAHYRASSDWLMPAKVIAEVRRIRSKRLAETPEPPPPADLTPMETIAWLRDIRSRIADGDDLGTVKAIKGAVPMPPELAEGMKTFGRLPADVERAAEGDPA